MRQLIPAQHEPITPFVDRVRPLYAERGVSTVLVAGGSGAFFEVADHVIALQDYHLRDVTAEAHQIAQDHRTTTAASSEETVFATLAPRVPLPECLRPAKKTKPARGRGLETIQYGRDTVDLAAVGQLVDPAQTEAIALALDRVAESSEGQRDISSLVDAVIQRMDAEGLDSLSSRRGHPGNLARPRRHEIHAAINRFRDLKLAKD